MTKSILVRSVKYLTKSSYIWKTIAQGATLKSRYAVTPVFMGCQITPPRVISKHRNAQTENVQYTNPCQAHSPKYWAYGDSGFSDAHRSSPGLSTKIKFITRWCNGYLGIIVDSWTCINNSPHRSQEIPPHTKHRKSTNKLTHTHDYQPHHHRSTPCSSSDRTSSSLLAPVRSAKENRHTSQRDKKQALETKRISNNMVCSFTHLRFDLYSLIFHQHVCVIHHTYTIYLSSLFTIVRA